MASDKSFVEFLTDQMGSAGIISHRAMFGEYAIYCDGKVVALVCNNQLFVTPTKAGGEYVGKPSEAPPYPGAKLYFLIEDAFEDREWISDLIRKTAQELMTVVKGKKVKRAKKQGSN